MNDFKYSPIPAVIQPQGEKSKKVELFYGRIKTSSAFLFTSLDTETAIIPKAYFECSCFFSGINYSLN